MNKKFTSNNKCSLHHGSPFLSDSASSKTGIHKKTETHEISSSCVSVFEPESSL